MGEGVANRRCGKSSLTPAPHHTILVARQVSVAQAVPVAVGGGRWDARDSKGGPLLGCDGGGWGNHLRGGAWGWKTAQNA